MKALVQLLEFIRLRVCIYGSFIAMSAFVIFNKISLSILLVGLGSFLISATTYSYNMMRDKEEDLINYGKLNLFVRNNKGKLIVLFCFLTALIVSFFLSFLAFLIALVLMLFNIFYSFFRLKKVFILKNIFTAAMSAPLFFYGTTSSFLTLEIVLYCIALFFFVLIASLVGDLRDYAGDKKANLKTFATITSYSLTKKVSYSLIFGFISFAYLFNLSAFYVLFPFLISVFLLLLFDKIKFAHKYLMMSVICIPIPYIL